MFRHAWRKTSTHGHDSASATHTFRTVTLTCAPILRSLLRIVAHCARAISVPATPRPGGSALRRNWFRIT